MLTEVDSCGVEVTQWVKQCGVWLKAGGRQWLEQYNAEQTEGYTIG